MVLAAQDSDAFKRRTELQMSTESEVHLLPLNAPIENEDGGLRPSTPNNIVLQQPAKKTTRQWAAWTRQEEESFFTALRQVGKNFEKITHRVQSKNKDQVRHYYYRLVRRMNKLLGPGLSLDAKNSKDTNAAMLRWWSLLEKYSCKASKLHLKPRRFKIFIEALEHQLLKDRKRSVRKRSCQGENCSSTNTSCISNQSRASGQDTCTVKLVFVDSQNIQKLGPARGSLKRNVNVGVNRSSCKAESTNVKSGRQRRKSGVVLSAAFKKWEKAAIAGVSLVADAAEHLEQSTHKELGVDQVQKDIQSVGKALPPLPTVVQNHFVECNINTPVKLKLQLFPMDDGTRRALEMDNHNPHLELTLSTRKRISSVLEHINRKWGSSSIASGEIMLFPYNAQRENLVGHQRWTRDSTVSAADVYAMIGSPPLFRLRYGWFSIPELESVALQSLSAPCCTPCVPSVNVENRSDEIMGETPVSLPSSGNQSEKHADPSDLQPHSVNENAGDMRLSNSTALSAGEWADSLTNISVGDLLLDVPQDMDAKPVAESSQCLHEIPFSCDSFDAAIAAHISRHHNKIGAASTFGSHATSIWDAEETCDAFSFQKNATLAEGVSRFSDIPSPASCKPARTNSMGSGDFLEELPDAEKPIDYPAHENPMDDCPTDPQALDHSVKDYNGLTDISWPDSLGPLDLDIPSSKYRSDDLILGDSLGGLSRLIASSLDAFQSCSFFGLDKKESTPAAEARETASLSDCKIGSQG